MVTNAIAYTQAAKTHPVSGTKAPDYKVSSQAMSVKDYDSYVRIEVILYCLKRESMFINVDEIIQSISAIYKNNEAMIKHPVREFYYSCDEGLLLLPQNTTLQFVSEAYKAGVLCFYVPGE